MKASNCYLLCSCKRHHGFSPADSTDKSASIFTWAWGLLGLVENDPQGRTEYTAQAVISDLTGSATFSLHGYPFRQTFLLLPPCLFVPFP